MQPGLHAMAAVAFRSSQNLQAIDFRQDVVPMTWPKRPPPVTRSLASLGNRADDSLRDEGESKIVVVD
jgi:hypothetical protein